MSFYPVLTSYFVQVLQGRHLGHFPLRLVCQENGIIGIVSQLSDGSAADWKIIESTSDIFLTAFIPRLLSLGHFNQFEKMFHFLQTFINILFCSSDRILLLHLLSPLSSLSAPVAIVPFIPVSLSGHDFLGAEEVFSLVLTSLLCFDQRPGTAGGLSTNTSSSQNSSPGLGFSPHLSARLDFSRDITVTITLTVFITVIITVILTTNPSLAGVCPDDAVHDVLQQVGEDVHVRGKEGAGLDLLDRLMEEQEEEKEKVLEVGGWCWHDG